MSEILIVDLAPLTLIHSMHQPFHISIQHVHLHLSLHTPLNISLRDLPIPVRVQRQECIMMGKIDQLSPQDGKLSLCVQVYAE